MLLNAVNPAQAIPILNASYAPLGAGVLISQDTILTAAHVVDEPKGIYYALCDGQPVKITAVDGDADMDLAVVMLDKVCNEPISKIARENEPVGDRVFAIGCPNRMCGFVTAGIVSSYTRKDEQLRLWTDAKIWFGNSGGPLLNEKNEVIGVCSQISSVNRLLISSEEGIKLMAQNYGIFIPVGEIRSFLNRFE